MPQPYTSNNIEHTHAKIVVTVTVIERQVSRDDTNDEVVHHQCNLRYTSK